MYILFRNIRTSSYGSAAFLFSWYERRFPWKVICRGLKLAVHLYEVYAYALMAGTETTFYIYVVLRSAIRAKVLYKLI